MVISSSNSTLTTTWSTTTTVAATTEVETQMQRVISQIVIAYCNLIHVAYFVLMFVCAELRTKPLTFVNHAVLANMFLPLGGLVMQYVQPADLSDHYVRLICPVFEIFWPFSVYIRTYSVVLIGIHRYLAVFHMHLFGRIKSSTIFYLTGILAAWMISICMPFINKLIFNTTYISFNCTDGYSPIFINRLLYVVFLITFSLMLPTVFNVAVYIIIIRKLHSSQIRRDESTSQLKDPTRRVSTSSFTTGGGGLTVPVLVRRVSFGLIGGSCGAKETKFANQFILMTVVILMGFFGVFFISLKCIWPNYFNVMISLRLAMRVYIAVLSSLIPILSVYFNPSRVRILNFVKNKSSSLGGSAAAAAGENNQIEN